MHLDWFQTASITVFLMLMLGSISLVDGQSHPMTMEIFSLDLKVEQDSVVITSFASRSVQSYEARITDLGDFQQLKLKPGASLLGDFRFEKFASEGGLVTTHRLKGYGKGKLFGIAIKHRRTRTYVKSGFGDEPVC